MWLCHATRARLPAQHERRLFRPLDLSFREVDRPKHTRALANHSDSEKAVRTSYLPATKKSTTMASMLVPLFYVVIVFGGLWVFSSIYRRRTLSKCNPY